MSNRSPATITTKEKSSVIPMRSSLIQRKCACGNSAGMAGECSDCQKKSLVQRKSIYQDNTSEVSPIAHEFPIQTNPSTPKESKPASNEIPPIVHEVINSSGQPLSTETRTFMESRFGYDFSAVKIHTDSKAEKSAQAINAVAYTVGNNIAFAPNAYRLNTPSGLHLLSHELSHVIQQDGASGLDLNQKISLANDPREQSADQAADAILRGEIVSPHHLGMSQNLSVQRAVSKICNPPSMWFALSNPAALPVRAFGAIAEALISSDIVSRNGVAPGNFYLDNPLAGPIDPRLVNFIIAKNPGMSLAHKIFLAAAAVKRPDVMMHQGIMTEFEEVKPNSIPGRVDGRSKVFFLSNFYPTLGLPYTAGTTYVPHPPFVIFSGMIPGTHTPIIVTFETSRNSNGLLVYDICVETDWGAVALAAIAIVIAIILMLLAKGSIERLPELPPEGLPTPTLAFSDTDTSLESTSEI
jgi:hypothetical protein